MEEDPLETATLWFLIGPTAVGKSDFALELAERAGAEILSMDSMLVYRGMDIGTAKPGAGERARVRHHLLDLVDPPERYDVQRYLEDVRGVLRDLQARARPGLFVGGTAFYLQALVHGLFTGPPVDLEVRGRLEARAAHQGSAALHAELEERDPASHAKIHPNDAKRVVRALEVLEQTGRPLSQWQQEWGWHGQGSSPRAHRIVGLVAPPAELEQRIRSRTRAMLEGGWVEEARAIRDGTGFGPTSLQALGYSEVLELADGVRTFEETADLIHLRTRQFARRQRAWFKRFEGANWLPTPGDPDEALRFLR